MKFYRDAVKGSSSEGMKRKFGWKDKISYALGDFGCNMSFALNSSLLLFWTQFMGIGLDVWGYMILALKIWDAINDPIIGGLMDFIKPKEGQSKFKPWIFRGSFVLLFAGAICFIPIPEAPMWAKILICLVGYMIWDMSYTIVNVPYGSLNSVITSDSGERAQLSTWRSLGSMVANVLIMVLVPMLTYNDKNELLGYNFIIIGLVLGIVGLISFQFLLRGTTERVQVDYEAQKKGHNYNYFKSLGAFFTNRAAVSLTLVTIFQLLALTFMQSVSTIYIQISFPGMSKLSGIISMMGFLPAFLFVPFIKKIVDKFGKKEASVWPMLFGVLSGILLIAIPFESFNEVLGMSLWILTCFFVSLSIAVNSMVCWAMVSDCIDYQELRTGVRQEGVVYATYSLGRKLAQGIGAALVSWLLLLTSYNPELKPLEQVSGTSSEVRIMLGIVYLVAFIIQFTVLLFGYNLNKKKVLEIEQQLGRSNEEFILPNENND